MNGTEKKKSNRVTVPQSPAAPLQRKDEVREWLDKLSKCCTNHIAAVIQTGTLLHSAKAALKGRWVEFKKSDASPFTPRKIEMLMRIAKNKTLADAQHYAHLPEAWTVLHALAGIAEDKLVGLIQSGQITPRLTLKAAKALDPNCKRTPAKPLSASGLARIRERIEESAPYWTSDEAEGVEEVIGCLEEIQEQIKNVTSEFTATHTT
jgi:hypothetical protein